MLQFTKAQMEQINRNYFYSRLDEFIYQYCKNDKLRKLMLDEPQTLRDIWEPAQNAIEEMSEQEAALLMILLAVCHCENNSQRFTQNMIRDLAANEIKIKSFIEGRGYFRFSDFDFPEMMGGEE